MRRLTSISDIYTGMAIPNNNKATGIRLLFNTNIVISFHSDRVYYMTSSENLIMFDRKICSMVTNTTEKILPIFVIHTGYDKILKIDKFTCIVIQEGSGFIEQYTKNKEDFDKLSIDQLEAYITL